MPESVSDTAVSAEDLRVLSGQLGGSEVFASSVAARCVYGFVSVIVLDGAPGPKELRGGLPYRFMSISNVIWLTCPLLNERIHELENRGFIRKMEILINDDRELSDKMSRAHAAFYYLRKKFFEFVIDSSQDKRLFRAVNSGVGGIREPGSLKCLHVHYAHYLAGGLNPAGCITDKLLGSVRDCGGSRCSRYI